MPLVLNALRGILVGFAVVATFILAEEVGYRIVGDQPDVHQSVTLESIATVALVAGVPAALLTGWLTAWAVRLRRPWPISITGFTASMTALCFAGHWAVVLPAYAISAAVLARPVRDPLAAQRRP